MITALPSIIGKLTSLKKLDVSENKITELPVSICELNEEMQLSVGRNPLEKPSVEQARQGIGAIRRFFGFSRSKATDEIATWEPGSAGKGSECASGACYKSGSGNTPRAMTGYDPFKLDIYQMGQRFEQYASGVAEIDKLVADMTKATPGERPDAADVVRRLGAMKVD